LDNFSLTDREPSATPVPPPANARDPLPDGADTEREIYGPGEHPFDVKYAIRSAQIRIEPNIYLDALMRDVVLFRSSIVVRKVDTQRDLMSLSEPIVVNCTGLGARDLFGDQELVPLKGQLTVLIPQEEVNYHTNGGLHTPPPPGALGIHTMSRRDGII